MTVWVPECSLACVFCGCVFEVCPSPGALEGLPKCGGHLFEGLPGPPGPTRPQKCTPKIRPDCLQVPRQLICLSQLFCSCAHASETHPTSRPQRVVDGQGFQGSAPASTRHCGELACMCCAATLMLPGRKSAFRAGFWPDCYRESPEIGPPAGLRPAGGPILLLSR